LVILRLFNIVGVINSKFKIFKFKKNNYQRLIFKLSQNYKFNKITKINYIIKNSKKIYPSRDFVNILDLLYIIKKILKITTVGKKKIKIFNVSSQISTPINQIISMIEKKIRNKLKIKYVKISKQELEYTKGSNKELNDYINFIPKKKLKIHSSCRI